VPAVRQVPRRWDDNVVLREDPRLVGVEVHRPRVAAIAARLVVVRHRQERGDGETRVMRWATGRRGRQRGLLSDGKVKGVILGEGGGRHLFLRGPRGRPAISAA
jgi:hypothetical protein